MQTARLYDLKHQRHLGEIPLAELTPDYVLAQVRGVEGKVWVLRADVADLRRDNPPAALTHPPFDEAITPQREQGIRSTWAR